MVAVTIQPADRGDTDSGVDTVLTALDELDAVQPEGDEDREIVADKGYHSTDRVSDWEGIGLRTYLSEPKRGRRRWHGQTALRDAVYRNRRRIRGARGTAAVATPRRVLGATECAPVRNRRAAAHASARPHQHLEARPDSYGWLQSRAHHASPDRRRHAARPARPSRGSDRDMLCSRSLRDVVAAIRLDARRLTFSRARAVGSTTTDHARCQLVSGSDLYHGLLGSSCGSPRVFAACPRRHANCPASPADKPPRCDQQSAS